MESALIHWSQSLKSLWQLLTCGRWSLVRAWENGSLNTAAGGLLASGLAHHCFSRSSSVLDWFPRTIDRDHWSRSLTASASLPDAVPAMRCSRRNAARDRRDSLPSKSPLHRVKTYTWLSSRCTPLLALAQALRLVYRWNIFTLRAH
jgi:hypothetical protein